jgi:DNA-binding IscR family transcriptional regulator
MARQWANGGGAFNSGAYVSAHHISGRLVADVLGVLASAGIVAETGEKTGTFVLLRPPEKITVGEIVSAIADAGTPPEALGLSKTQGPLRDYFAQSDSRLSEHLSVSIAKLASPPEGGNAS